MAIEQFVPEFWSARFRRFLDAKLVFASPQTTNRDYEGEIAQSGDTVHILRPGAGATVKTYTKNTDMDAPERPDGDDLTLVVDQSKYYNTAIDDVDRVQAVPRLFDAWAERSARNMRKVIDSFTAARMQAAVPVGNQLGTDAVPIEVKADGSGDITPYEFFVELAALLGNVDADDEDLWAVINPDLKAEVLLDPRYIPAGNDATRTGQIGEIAGFTIMQTTAVPQSPGSGGGAHVPNIKVIGGAGNYATTFAAQLAKLEAYRIERQFGDGLKGLQLYGAKVVEPETLVMGHVAK